MRQEGQDDGQDDADPEGAAGAREHRVVLGGVGQEVGQSTVVGRRYDEVGGDSSHQTTQAACQWETREDERVVVSVLR